MTVQWWTGGAETETDLRLALDLEHCTAVPPPLPHFCGCRVLGLKSLSCANVAVSVTFYLISGRTLLRINCVIHVLRHLLASMLLITFDLHVLYSVSQKNHPPCGVRFSDSVNVVIVLCNCVYFVLCSSVFVCF